MAILRGGPLSLGKQAPPPDVLTSLSGTGGKPEEDNIIDNGDEVCV
jgi:hypothetical protein